MIMDTLFGPMEIAEPKPLKPLKIERQCSFDPCDQMARWSFNDEPICDTHIVEGADVNSDIEQEFIEALSEIRRIDICTFCPEDDRHLVGTGFHGERCMIGDEPACETCYELATDEDKQ